MGIPTHKVIRKRHRDDEAIFMKMNIIKGEEVEAAVKEAVRAGGRLDV